MGVLTGGWGGGDKVNCTPSSHMCFSGGGGIGGEVYWSPAPAVLPWHEGPKYCIHTNDQMPRWSIVEPLIDPTF